MFNVRRGDRDGGRRGMSGSVGRSGIGGRGRSGSDGKSGVEDKGWATPDQG